MTTQPIRASGRAWRRIRAQRQYDDDSKENANSTQGHEAPTDEISEALALVQARRWLVRGKPRTNQREQTKYRNRNPEAEQQKSDNLKGGSHSRPHKVSPLNGGR